MVIEQIPHQRSENAIPSIQIDAETLIVGREHKVGHLHARQSQQQVAIEVGPEGNGTTCLTIFAGCLATGPIGHQFHQLFRVVRHNDSIDYGAPSGEILIRWQSNTEQLIHGLFLEALH